MMGLLLVWGNDGAFVGVGKMMGLLLVWGNDGAFVGGKSLWQSIYNLDWCNMYIEMASCCLVLLWTIASIYPLQ